MRNRILGLCIGVALIQLGASAVRAGGVTRGVSGGTLGAVEERYPGELRAVICSHLRGDPPAVTQELYLRWAESALLRVAMVQEPDAYLVAVGSRTDASPGQVILEKFLAQQGVRLDPSEAFVGRKFELLHRGR